MTSISCPPIVDQSAVRRSTEQAAGQSRPTPPSRSLARRVVAAIGFYAGQILLLGGLFMVYRLGRSFADGREGEALHNALDVWHFERLLDLPDESAVQRMALHSTGLLEWANHFYIGVHFPAAIAFLLWVMVFQRAHWPRVRNVIVLSTGVALVVHILYPLAPPRFLPAVSPDIPLVDTGVVIGPSAYAGAGAEAANQYAAMPSLHVGWAILEAWGVITILRWRARWLAVAHPTVTALVVVITANHYWLDGLIGGGLVCGAVWLTRPPRWQRLTGVALAPARWVRVALFPPRTARPLQTLPRQAAAVSRPGAAAPRLALAGTDTLAEPDASVRGPDSPGSNGRSPAPTPRSGDEGAHSGELAATGPDLAATRTQSAATPTEPAATRTESVTGAERAETAR